MPEYLNTTIINSHRYEWLKEWMNEQTLGDYSENQICEMWRMLGVFGYECCEIRIELLKSLDLISQLDDFCVSQFKKRLAMYVDEARSLPECPESERKDWSDGLAYNIRADLESYIKQAKATDSELGLIDDECVAPPSEGEGKEKMNGAEYLRKRFKVQADKTLEEYCLHLAWPIRDVIILLDDYAKSLSSPSQELPRDYEKITCQKCSGVGYTQESHGSSYTDTRCDWCNGHGHYFRQKPEQDRSTNRSV